jgi:hypothetical protein
MLKRTLLFVLRFKGLKYRVAQSWSKLWLRSREGQAGSDARSLHWGSAH